MSIHYDFYRQSGIFAADDKVIARINEHRTCNTETLAQRIESATSLTRADVVAVLDAVAKAMSDELLQGNSVHLEGIGYFSLTMDAKVVRNEKGQYYAKNPRIKSLRFRAEKKMTARFDAAHFVPNGHFCTSRPPIDSTQAEMLIDTLLAVKPVFTPAEFARHANMHLQQAYKQLKQLEASGKLKNAGTPYRKIYLRA